MQSICRIDQSEHSIRPECCHKSSNYHPPWVLGGQPAISNCLKIKVGRFIVISTKAKLDFHMVWNSPQRTPGDNESLNWHWRTTVKWLICPDCGFVFENVQCCMFNGSSWMGPFSGCGCETDRQPIRTFSLHRWELERSIKRFIISS